jgi:hypothetical protein
MILIFLNTIDNSVMFMTYFEKIHDDDRLVTHSVMITLLLIKNGTKIQIRILRKHYISIYT